VTLSTSKINQHRNLLILRNIFRSTCNFCMSHRELDPIFYCQPYYSPQDRQIPLKSIILDSSRFASIYTARVTPVFSTPKRVTYLPESLSIRLSTSTGTPKVTPVSLYFQTRVPVLVFSSSVSSIRPRLIRPPRQNSWHYTKLCFIYHGSLIFTKN